MSTSRIPELVTIMAEAAAGAVAEAAGIAVHAGRVVAVPATEAIAASGSMINRSDLARGADLGSLLTVVPASGLVTAEVGLDAMKLTDALVTGGVAGIAAAGGPLLQALPPQMISSASGIDLAGAEAFAFDLVAGTKPITAIWIVEATLGSLLGGSIPVDEPPVAGPSVAPAALPDLGRAGRVNGARPIDVLAEVVTRLSVEIAHGTVQVRDLVAMAPGKVFALDRRAGDAVDILVNGAPIARGEIVVVGSQLGVQISKICEPAR